MKKLNKSKMTVIVLFVLMLISIALLLVFIFMAINNLEEKQDVSLEVQPVIEEQISLSDMTAERYGVVMSTEQEASDHNREDAFLMYK